MAYLVRFYEEGNAQDIPSVWPSRVERIATIEGVSSEYINSHKEDCNIPPDATYMTQEEYLNHLETHRHLYVAWKLSNRNPDVREEKIKIIKQLAQEKIVSPLGYTTTQTTEFLAKQINMNGRASEILLALMLGTATDEEKAELQAMKTFFGRVKAIRTYSNYLEEQIKAKVEVDIYSGWPE